MTPFALLLALIWSCLVAAFIGATKQGRWVAEHLTWLTVVVGVGGDLLIMLLVADAQGRVLWWHVLAVFVVSGIPVSVQNIGKLYRKWLEVMDVASDSLSE